MPFLIPFSRAEGKTYHVQVKNSHLFGPNKNTDQENRLYYIFSIQTLSISKTSFSNGSRITILFKYVHITFMLLLRKSVEKNSNFDLHCNCLTTIHFYLKNKLFLGTFSCLFQGLGWASPASNSQKILILVFTYLHREELFMI